MINPAYEPGRDQLLALIFRPGFSTASTVSDLAGRGVGMDVVSQQVKALGGFVRLDTDDGLGTTVEIVLPRRVMDPKKEGEETAGSGEERTAPQELATPREHEGG